MATVAPTFGKEMNNTLVITWASLSSTNTSGDAVPPQRLADYADRSVQIIGTTGAATIKFQGSNDGTNYVSLTDPQGNVIEKASLTASSALEQVMENTLYVKPVVTSGDGSTAITVVLVARRDRGGRTV